MLINPTAVGSNLVCLSASKAMLSLGYERFWHLWHAGQKGKCDATHDRWRLMIVDRPQLITECVCL